MPNISDTSPVKLGNAIPFPHISNRFHVTFLKNRTTEKLEGSDFLTSQVVACKMFEDIESAEMVLSVTFEEDIGNRVSKLAKCFKTQQPVTICVTLLDGDNVALRSTFIHNAELRAVDHSELNYAPAHSLAPVDFTLDFPRIESVIDESSVAQMSNPVDVGVVLTMLSKARVRTTLPSRITDSSPSTVQSKYTFVASLADVESEYAEIEESRK